MKLLDHVVCLGRPIALYAVGALAGVAWAADAGAVAPMGMPDIGGVAGPIAGVLAVWLLRGGGPAITVRLETVDGDPPKGKR